MTAEIKEAHKKIMGAWVNEKSTIYFMFDKADPVWDKSFLVFKISGKIKKMPYHLSHFPTSDKKFFIRPTVPVKPFESGPLILEIIDDNKIEIKYYEDLFKLTRLADGLEAI